MATRVFVDYKSFADRKRVQSSICQRGKQSHTLTYLCSARINVNCWLIARAIGEARMMIAEDNGRAIGQKRDYDNETVAVVAEYVIEKLLEEELAAPVPFVLGRADKGVDFNFKSGARADIKASEKACAFVNNATHIKKRPDFYIFAHVDAKTDVIDFFVISAQAVDTWHICKRCKGKPIEPTRWYRMKELPAVSDYDTLVADLAAT